MFFATFCCFLYKCVKSCKHQILIVTFLGDSHNDVDDNSDDGDDDENADGADTQSISGHPASVSNYSRGGRCFVTETASPIGAKTTRPEE